MGTLATIQILEHARGQRYSARLQTTDEPLRIVVGPRHNDLVTAVLNVLANYDNAKRWHAGKRGRPPAARDVPNRLEKKSPR